jgi:hypothetical protein
LKDKEARAVINLLSKRIDQLEHEIELLKHPHPKDCKCDQCTGFKPDYFIVDLVTSHGGRYATWWER